MSEIEALDLPAFVIGLLDDLLADVEWGNSQESDVEFDRHWQNGSYFVFVIVLVMSVTT